eukprot:TRINITY_DN4054_c0_g1::TRINITY_DN4054_c0_g1_i1::g.11923::m.11923 TRINITY_DN4054_c0_g1::TRINITY_DN4054_c0_g1_i1::g.11923  ORF type:complete len:104 (+),score=-6.10,Av_adeno_fibre/PF06536.6/0.039 TRINITY_DN4054_c0_g1_i1:521-832(+)
MRHHIQTRISTTSMIIRTAVWMICSRSRFQFQVELKSTGKFRGSPSTFLQRWFAETILSQTLYRSQTQLLMSPSQTSTSAQSTQLIPPISFTLPHCLVRCPRT